MKILLNRSSARSIFSLQKRCAFSTNTVLFSDRFNNDKSWDNRGSYRGSRSKRWDNDDGYKRDSYKRNGFNSDRRDSRGGWKNSRFDNRGKFGRNGRSDKMDDDLLSRTRTNEFHDDGLMGKPNYEVATKEEIKDLKWTDLIPEDGQKSDNPSVSTVPTSELASKRLLSLPLVNSLIHNRKYEWLTSVQAQTLLPILRGESVVVRAKTGTGKTAAFSIPIIQKVIEAKKESPKSNHVHGLIISPTRELAQQIADEIFKITQFGGLNHIKVQSLVGGVDKRRQIRAAGFDGRGKVADIVVATPGRLVDILQEGDIADSYFHSLSSRVLDEADRILDIGFEREIGVASDIIDKVSQKREIPLLLFSATADRKMQKFARDQFGERVKVVDTVPKDEPTANELVEQHSTCCKNWLDVFEASSREISEAYELAQKEGQHFKAIVFLPTTVMVDAYESILRKLFGRDSPLTKNIMGVHGKRSQSSRQNRSDKFRKEKDAVLITTDVVARGMDFPKVTHVFQLGPPTDVASYVHRIGRTARIGNSGKSYLYYTTQLRSYIDALSREGIVPKTSVYESNDEQFTEKFRDTVTGCIDSEDEAQELLKSLMSYISVFRSKYNVNPRMLMGEVEPLVQLLGIEEMALPKGIAGSWSDKRSRGGNRGRNYGSSRRSKMRW